MTLRALKGQRINLRSEKVGGAVGQAIRAGRERPGFRVVVFSIQRDHIHLVVEADDRDRLSRGMQGLVSSIARRANRAMKRRGSLFAERYHGRALFNAIEVRRAFVYVLGNARKHGETAELLDPYSSARWFFGFSIPIGPPGSGSPVAIPRTSLASDEWQWYGLIHPSESPRGWV